MKYQHLFSPLAITLAILQPESQIWAKDLVDLIPGLYGGDGITLAPPGINPETGEPFPSHVAHFSIQSTAAINQLNQLIASQVRPFPITPSAGGITFEFDPAQGTYRETSETLGPLVTERPQTLGKGQFSLGLAFTYFEYDEFEGKDLSNLQATALHDFFIIPPNDSPQSFENDVVAIDFDVDLRIASLALSGVYGIADRLDLSVIIPIIDVDMDVNANATVVVSELNPFPGVHRFDPLQGGDKPTDSASGSATGIGDILLGAKYHWLGRDKYDVSGAVRLKLATGDEDNFLGTGTTSIQPFLIGSYRIYDTPTIHANARTNLGFEVDFDDSERNEFIYTAGVDVGNPTITGVVDLIGRHELDDNDGIGEDIIDVAVGLKWSPIKNLIFSGNVLLPANDQGLRSDIIGTVGVEYRNF